MTKLNAQTIQEILKASLEGQKGHRCAVMFSGGFDSMLMALLAQSCGIRVTAVTVGFENFNPHTVAEAALLAKRMELPHYILHVTLREFLSSFALLPSLTDRPLLDLDLVLIHAAFKKYDPGTTGRTFISGMGSDQWFGDRAFEQAKIDEDAHCQVARIHGFDFIFPFLLEKMRDISKKLPDNEKKNKRLLRGMVTEDQARLVPGRHGQREIQIPRRVRRLLVKIYGDGENAGSDDEIIHRAIERLWLKKNPGSQE